jgi:ABC-type bacteriocin/lantibiotic exporter with double-glycine peptidase domain
MNRFSCSGFVMAIIFFMATRSFGQAPIRSASAESQPDYYNQFICGPKCVKHVLTYYGQQAELTDLIREIQWPDYEQGATMAALAKALERRGIFVRAMVVPVSIPLRWLNPVILHFANKQGGHFAVLEPVKNGNGVVLWSDELHQETFSTDDCFKKRSETILVTSNQELVADRLSSILGERSIGGLLWVGVPFLPFLALILPLLRKGMSNKS